MAHVPGENHKSKPGNNGMLECSLAVSHVAIAREIA
jgi:hypothetical protein